MVCAAHAQNADAQNAAAQSVDEGVALEEIVVTAEKRESSIQTTSASIVAVQGSDLASQGVTQLDDALRAVPGLVISQGPTGFVPTVRGIGPSLPTNLGGDAGISVNYDGVYNNADIFSRAGFYDLARIEVIRGPQGTLYGRNAEGGVLNVESNNPSQKSEGAAGFTLGNYNLRQYTGMINIPLSDTFAIRLAGSSVKREGYLNNGQDDNDAQGFRVKALWTPTDSTSLLLGGEWTNLSGEGIGTVTPFVSASSVSDPWSNTRSPYQSIERHGYKVWAKFDTSLGFADLVVVPAYQWLSNPKQVQNNGGTNSIAPGVGGLKQDSLEARIQSRAGSHITWMVGAYGYKLNQDPSYALASAAGNGNTIVVATGAVPNVDSSSAKSGGLFAQATLPITDYFRLIAGYRHSTDDKSAYFTNTNSSQSGSWSSNDWKAGVEFNVAADSMLYATYATGYRPGGLSPAPSAPPPSVTHQVFDQEELKSIELGSKNEFLDHKLRVNLSVYSYDYTNFQYPNLTLCGAPTGNTIVCDNQTPGSIFNLDILNFGKVTNRGAELETMYLITHDDRLQVTAAYLDSKVKSHEVVGLPFEAPFDMYGYALPNSPKLTYNANYEHDILVGALRITPSVTARHVDDSYVSITPLATSNRLQPAYWTYDAAILFAGAGDKWTFNVYGKNLSNEAIKSNVLAGSMMLSAPRTYGVAFNAKF